MSKSLKELFKGFKTVPQREFDWGENEYIERIEKALVKAIKKITLDNDSGMQSLDNQYEYWKEWLFTDEER